MRNVAAEYVSVDGVREDPGGAEGFEQGGWTNPFWNDGLAAYQHDQLFRSDALLLGRSPTRALPGPGPLGERVRLRATSPSG